MYVTANTCTELSAPVLDSTKLQQSAAAWNLNAKCPPINGSGFSPNNGCTIQQKLPHNWWNVNQCRKKLKTAKHVWWMTNFPDGHQKPHNTECAYTTISLCWVLLSPTGSAAFIYISLTSVFIDSSDILSRSVMHDWQTYFIRGVSGK